MAATTPDISIRFASPEELQAVYGLVHELAVYEREPNEPSISLETFVRQGTQAEPWYKTLVAVAGAEVVGMLLYFRAFSTWKGAMYYMDDIVVEESWRRHGIGAKLMERLLQEALDNEVNLIKWQVLDWNEPAIQFYKKYNIQMDGGEWLNCRLFREDFKR